MSWGSRPSFRSPCCAVRWGIGRLRHSRKISLCSCRPSEATASGRLLDVSRNLSIGGTGCRSGLSVAENRNPSRSTPVSMCTFIAAFLTSPILVSAPLCSTSLYGIGNRIENEPLVGAASSAGKLFPCTMIWACAEKTTAIRSHRQALSLWLRYDGALHGSPQLG
jgi:hypothetical protein